MVNTNGIEVRLVIVERVDSITFKGLTRSKRRKHGNKNNFKIHLTQGGDNLRRVFLQEYFTISVSENFRFVRVVVV